MSKKENTIWGMHPGKIGDAENLFLTKNVVALGWAQIGDLSLIHSDRDAFKTKIKETYPEMKTAALPGVAGQLFRFVHEIKKGDIIVCPLKKDQKVHIGIVQGDYMYNSTLNEDYPNMRSVKWKTSIARKSLSKRALYEIGTAMSLFQIKTFADEFRSIIKKQKKTSTKK